MATDWFVELFGFEESPRSVESLVKYDSDSEILYIESSGKSFHVGEFSVPSLNELKDMLGDKNDTANRGGLTFENICGDVGVIIDDPRNEDAVFQAASQFNCLEMINSAITPEAGITRYQADRTQGPTVALRAPAGTLYRNYLVNEKHAMKAGKGIGQTSGRQIDTSFDLHELLKSRNGKEIWVQKNGYMTPTGETSIAEIGTLIAQEEGGEDFLASCRDALRVGVHWDTETRVGHRVAQVYCSACPVAYDRVTQAVLSKDPTTNRVPSKRELWEPLAKLVLQSCYESTLLVAGILALRKGSRRTLYLTKVGGGAFGNADSWIAEAIQKAIDKYRHLPVDVKVVHFGTALPKPTDRYSNVSLAALPQPQPVAGTKEDKKEEEEN